MYTIRLYIDIDIEIDIDIDIYIYIYIFYFLSFIKIVLSCFQLSRTSRCQKQLRVDLMRLYFAAAAQSAITSGCRSPHIHLQNRSKVTGAHHGFWPSTRSFFKNASSDAVISNIVMVEPRSPRLMVPVPCSSKSVNA